MADDGDLTSTIHLSEDEVPLITFLMTTRGVHVDPQPILGTLDVADQLEVMRDAATGLRKLADALDARAGLAADIEDIGEAMR